MCTSRFTRRAWPGPVRVAHQATAVVTPRGASTGRWGHLSLRRAIIEQSWPLAEKHAEQALEHRPGAKVPGQRPCPSSWTFGSGTGSGNGGSGVIKFAGRSSGSGEPTRATNVKESCVSFQPSERHRGIIPLNGCRRQDFRVPCRNPAQIQIMGNSPSRFGPQYSHSNCFLRGFIGVWAAGRSANGGRKARIPGPGASRGMQARTRLYWPEKQPVHAAQFTHTGKRSSVSNVIYSPLPPAALHQLARAFVIGSGADPGRGLGFAVGSRGRIRLASEQQRRALNDLDAPRRCHRPLKLGVHAR